MTNEEKKAIEILDEFRTRNLNFLNVTTSKAIDTVVRALKSTEPEGEWILRVNGDCEHWNECSVCGFEIGYRQDYKICPNCKTKMRRVKY